MGRVLVVDDHELAREVIEDTLRADGHEVEGVWSGTGMMHALLNRRFDAVVLDLKMPGISGFRLARILRRCVDDPPPVVLFSALPETELAGLAARLGVRDYLPKGASAEVLRATTRRAMDRQGPAFADPVVEFVPAAPEIPAPLDLLAA